MNPVSIIGTEFRELSSALSFTPDHSDEGFEEMPRPGNNDAIARVVSGIYDLILNRHRASSFVITSNRAVDEWLGLFEDPILGNSALDRLANASYQITVEGQSYRERLSPHRALLGAGREGGD